MKVKVHDHARFPEVGEIKSVIKNADKHVARVEWNDGQVEDFIVEETTFEWKSARRMFPYIPKEIILKEFGCA
jgi:hypothetical protein